MIKNVIFNSRNFAQAYTANAVPGTPDNYGDISYLIDWSFLEEGKRYKVDFSFVSEQILNITANHTAQLSVPLTATAEVYSAGAGVYKTQSNIIGTIYPQLVGAANGQLKASVYNDNPSFTVHGRPSNNVVNVRVLGLDGVVDNIGVHYVLTLSFEEVR